MTADRDSFPVRHAGSSIFSRPLLAWRSLGILATGLAILGVAPHLDAAFSISTTTSTVNVQPLQYEPGSSVRFGVDTAPTPSGDYQWFHDELPIPAATAASLTLTNLTSPDSGNYRLRVTSGGVTTFSENTVTLNVISSPPAPIDPSFTADVPADLKVTAILSVQSSIRSNRTSASSSSTHKASTALPKFSCAPSDRRSRPRVSCIRSPIRFSPSSTQKAPSSRKTMIGLSRTRAATPPHSRPR